MYLVLSGLLVCIIAGLVNVSILNPLDSNHFVHQFQTLEVIVRSVRSINTMSGTRSFAVAVACDMEHYPQVINALGAENKEVCYIYSTGTRKNSKNQIY